MGPRLRQRVTQIVNPKLKLYIPWTLGIEGFFASLQTSGARHAVLRWFEDLPHVEPGHDLDILVADESIGQVRHLLSAWPLGQKIDIYSESGFEGTGYQPELLGDVPAFPPEVAAAFLGSATERPGGWSVPAPREHFLGLAYHAVYLKGYDSGLPSDEGTPPRKTGSRDYAAVLTQLAGQSGWELEQPVTMKSLDRMLEENGWKPDRNHLTALAKANAWITEAC